MRPDTPFFIASVTKRFIATLVLQAHERGDLALDDPITILLPAELTDGLHVHKGVDHTPAITVHHLLTHTSGLPDYFDRPSSGPSLYKQLVAGNDRSWTLADVARWVREEHRPHFPPQDLAAPRQRARYSDTGFQLLVAILEQVTGRSFADLLHGCIFEPLGMAHSWLPGRSKPLADTPEAALIHAGRRPLELPQLVVSCNDLISTAADLLRFQQALTGGELFDRPATLQRLTERANLLRNMPPNRYGVGTWFFRVNRLVAPGRKPATLIGHAGVTGTWLFTCPELDVHLVGAVDQAAGQRMPFRIMLQMLRAVAPRERCPDSRVPGRDRHCGPVEVSAEPKARAAGGRRGQRNRLRRTQDAPFLEDCLQICGEARRRGAVDHGVVEAEGEGQDLTGSGSTGAQWSTAERSYGDHEPQRGDGDAPGQAVTEHAQGAHPDGGAQASRRARQLQGCSHGDASGAAGESLEH